MRKSKVVAAGFCVATMLVMWLSLRTDREHAVYERYVASVAAGVRADSASYQSRSYSNKGLSMQNERQLEQLKRQIESIVNRGTAGDVYETGMWRAGTSIFIVAVFRAYERYCGIPSKRNFYFFDSFEGFRCFCKETKLAVVFF